MRQRILIVLLATNLAACMVPFEAANLGVDGSFSFDPGTGDPPTDPPTGVTVAADFNYTCSATTCNFRDRSTGSITNWSWNFGDGGTSSAASPTHAFADGGTYKVTLFVRDAGSGDSSSISRYVIVKPIGSTSLKTGWLDTGEFVEIESSVDSPLGDNAVKVWENGVLVIDQPW